jgi:hypothetical protein
MLRNLYRLLAPPLVHTIYYHRARACVINYWHAQAQGRQRRDVLPVASLPTTPGEKTRKIGPEQPEDAMLSPLIFAKNAKLAKAICQMATKQATTGASELVSEWSEWNGGPYRRRRSPWIQRFRIGRDATKAIHLSVSHWRLIGLMHK